MTYRNMVDEREAVIPLYRDCQKTAYVDNDQQIDQEDRHIRDRGGGGAGRASPTTFSVGLILILGLRIKRIM